MSAYVISDIKDDRSWISGNSSTFECMAYSRVCVGVSLVRTPNSPSPPLSFEVWELRDYTSCSDLLKMELKIPIYYL